MAAADTTPQPTPSDPVKALEIAAKKTGLRPDQIERAVNEHRSALRSLKDEPEWQAVLHMHGKNQALAQYNSPETSVTLQYESYKRRGEWEQDKVYIFAGKPFETWQEAHSAELLAGARTQPYSVAP